MYIPTAKNVWTTGTTLSSITSILSLLSMLGAIIWFSSHVSDAVAAIPPTQAQVYINTKDIVVLKTQQQYTDMRYAEIMAELAKINEKLDRRNHGQSN